MINILKHIEELRPFLREMIIKGDLAMVNGSFHRCKDVKCKECEFYNSIYWCVDTILEWLFSENEEEVKDEELNEKS